MIVRACLAAVLAELDYLDESRRPTRAGLLLAGIYGDVDLLVLQFDLPVRGRSGHLGERFPDVLPPDMPAADRVHRRDRCAVRPDVRQRRRIPIGHAVQPGIELLGRLADFVCCRHALSSSQGRGGSGLLQVRP